MEQITDREDDESQLRGAATESEVPRQNSFALPLGE